MKSYLGSCHCGAVQIEVEADLTRAIGCNCSICQKKGQVHLIVDKPQFRLVKGEEALSLYQFGTETAKHLFCKFCGISAFYVPRSYPNGYSVNARCLDGIDLSQLNIEPFDGRNWEKNVGTLTQT